MKKIKESVSPQAISKIFSLYKTPQQQQSQEYKDLVKNIIDFLASSSTKTDQDISSFVSQLRKSKIDKLTNEPAPFEIPRIKKQEALSPSQVNDIVADFESPVRGNLTGDTKDYVDTLKALAGFISTKPNAHPKQVKDFLKNYKQDMQLKNKKPNTPTPEKPAEPVKFGSPAAKQFQQQSQTGNMPSLSSLAGSEKSPQQKLGFPHVPDKKSEPDSFKDLKTGDRLASDPSVGDLGKQSTKPITPAPLSLPTNKGPSTPSSVGKEKPAVKVKKSKSTKIPDATKHAKLVEPEKDQGNDEEMPSMSNIARAQRLVR